MPQIKWELSPPVVVSETRGAPAAPANVTGDPLPAAPVAGLIEIHGPLTELAVYAALPPDWNEAWLRLIARVDQMEVPLDLKRGGEVQSPMRSQNAAGAPLGEVSLLFRVSARPA